MIRRYFCISQWLRIASHTALIVALFSFHLPIHIKADDHIVQVTGFARLLKSGLSDNNDTDTNFPLAGGFTPDSVVNATNKRECPYGYVMNNKLCWIDGADYDLSPQSSYMEYVDSSDGSKNSVFYNAITASTGDNALIGNQRVPNIDVRIWTDDDIPPLHIQLPDGTNKKLRRKQKMTLRTNAEGRVIFSIMDDGELSLPVIHMQSDFPEHHQFSFMPTASLYHRMANLSKQQLNDAANIPLGNQDLDDAHSVMTQLAAAALNAGPTDGDEGNSLKKRDKIDAHASPPYSKSDDRTRVYRNAHSRTISLGVNHMTRLEIHPRSYSLPDHLFEQQNQLQLYKRTFAEDYWQKIRHASNSTMRWLKSTFVDIPRAIFNGTHKNDTQGYMDRVIEETSDRRKVSLEMLRDYTRLLPFGNTLSDKLGLNELVANTTSNDLIIITPAAAGIELFVYGPKKAFRTFVKSMQAIGAVLKGIFSRFGIAFRAVLDTLRAIFKWDDILMNHRILAAHYMKMVPFMRNEIVSRRGNFNTDLSNKVNQINNITGEATKLFADGNLSDLTDLFTKANAELLKNVTSNPSLTFGNSTNGDLQSTFITDHLVTNVDSMSVDVTDEDRKSIMDVPKEALKNIGALGDDTLNALKEIYANLVAELKKDNWNLKKLMELVQSLTFQASKFAIEKAVQAFLIAFDFVISLIDRILRAHLRIPYLTNFYEKVLVQRGSKFSLYDLYSLGAAVPLTVGFKSFYDGRNLFTQVEADVLVATENPEYYVENLVAVGLQVPGRTTSRLRAMYKFTVSLLLGAGYSTGHWISSLIGVFTRDTFGLYFLRAPFEFMSILCSFPWSWYTDTRTEVGVNIRFISWLVLFTPLFLGWPAENMVGVTGFSPWVFFSSLAVAIPNIYMVLRVWAQDLKLIKDDTLFSDGSTSMDITMKHVARLVRYTSMIILSVHRTPGAVGGLFRLMILASAGMHVGRLYLDIPAGSVYSV
eukprot:Partr_v1_DN28836_c1_g1_i2_m33073